MNELLNADLLEHPLLGIALRVSLILIGAWLLNFALQRQNPRWRQLVWRVSLLAIFATPVLGVLVPRYEVTVAVAPVPPPVAETVPSPAPPAPDEPEFSAEVAVADSEAGVEEPHSQAPEDVLATDVIATGNGTFDEEVLPDSEIQERR